MTTMFNSLVHRAAKKAKKQYHVHKRPASPPSPASFTTPEVIEISDHASSDHDDRLFAPPYAAYMTANHSSPALGKDPYASTPSLAAHNPTASTTSLTPYLVAPRPAPSPLPRINLALPLEPLGIQFPTDILGPEAIALRRRPSENLSKLGHVNARGEFPPDGFICIPLHGSSALGSKAEPVDVDPTDTHGSTEGLIVEVRQAVLTLL